ncbi:hypothetical protein FIU82_06155 [Pseudoalteromonas sp. THAF3]|uniref:hypothetical protein n=1 Tax=Pseudoalteromonas sp. THAF3 TaxID=2587843 RepID=UPI0012689839|nr:hypothetical protein [Pseudoalteromonas sp. THAF3]QFU04599.1 hypothetical protein FIU82_06155 [Pseudoalteromonas sp. THAF3]
MVCTCPHCLHCEDDLLFREDLVEASGLEETLPDLLWGALKNDLKGLNPLAVYRYEWQEVDTKKQSKASILIKGNPYIDLGRGGLYVGKLRNASDINATLLLDRLTAKAL